MVFRVVWMVWTIIILKVSCALYNDVKNNKNLLGGTELITRHFNEPPLTQACTLVGLEDSLGDAPVNKIPLIRIVSRIDSFINQILI